MSKRVRDEVSGIRQMIYNFQRFEEGTLSFRAQLQLMSQFHHLKSVGFILNGTPSDIPADVLARLKSALAEATTLHISEHFRTIERESACGPRLVFFFFVCPFLC